MEPELLYGKAFEIEGRYIESKAVSDDIMGAAVKDAP
jgi:hypothetical protein